MKNIWKIKEFGDKIQNRIMNYSDIEILIRDVTNDDKTMLNPDVMDKIAIQTKKYIENKEIVQLIMSRIYEDGKNWRRLYKTLLLIEYLILHGSNNFINSMRNHIYEISKLSGFHHIDDSGKDCGINVKFKVEKLTTLLKNDLNIRTERKSAQNLKNKLCGVSHTPIHYKNKNSQDEGWNNQNPVNEIVGIVQSAYSKAKDAISDKLPYDIGKHVLPPNNTRYSYHSGAGRENFVKNVKIKKYEDLIADDLNFKSVITEETKSVDSDKFGDFVQSRTPKKQDTININNSIYVNNIDDDTSQVDNSTNLFNTLQKIDYDSFSGFSTEQKNEPIVLIDKIIKNPQNEQNSTHIEMDLLDMSSKFVNNEDLLNTFEKQTSSLSISTLDNFKSLTPSKSPKISVSESKHSKNDVFSDLFDSMYTTN